MLAQKQAQRFEYLATLYKLVNGSPLRTVSHRWSLLRLNSAMQVVQMRFTTYYMKT